MIRRLSVLLALCLGTFVTAQEPQPQKPPQVQQQDATPATIQTAIDQVKADTSLTDELRNSLLDTYNKALESAKAIAALTDKAQQFTSEKQDAPNKLQLVKKQLKEFAPPPAPTANDRTKTADLEQQLANAQQAQKDAAQAVADRDASQTARADRRTQIPARQAEIRKALDALPTQITDTSLDPRLLAARSLALTLDKRRLQVEQTALQAELDALDATGELASTQRDLEARDAAAKKIQADAWQTIVQARRVAEAEQAQQKAREDKLNARADLKGLADENARVASQLPALAAAQKQAEDNLNAARDSFKALEKDFTETKDLATVGSASAIGPLLRQRRTTLPFDAREQRRLQKDLRQRREEAQLHVLQFRKERDALASELGASLAAADESTKTEWERNQTKERIKNLLDERLGNLRTLNDGWNNVWGNLIKLQAEQDKLANLVLQYRAFVNERVLWIRSSQPIWEMRWNRPEGDRESAAGVREAATWLADPITWLETLAALWAAWMAEPWQLLLVLAVLTILAMKRVLTNRLRLHAEAARRGQNVAYLPTALALLDTLLLALPIPLLLWLLAWRLSGSLDCSEATESFAKCVAAGANQSAWFLLLLLLIGRVVRQDGLGESHFQWSHEGLAVLRSNLKLLLPVAFPLTFALGMLEQHADDSMLGSLGRLLLLPTLVLLTLCFWRVLHPARGVAGTIGTSEKSWVRRFRGLWFVLGVGTPLAMLGMVILGYEFTAMELAHRLEYTVGVVLAGTLVHGMIARGLVLERRKLSIQRMRARLAAAKAGGDAAAAQAAGNAEASDPSRLTQQTQTVLYGAVSLVVVLLALQFWVDVLPALGVLRNVPIWSDSTITLADLLLSLLLLLATVVAARNLPGLLELLVLQRLHIAAGERNAITTLARYALVIIGLVSSFSVVGIGWAKVQWLVAAVSVGLGFGLQEIFANFVSGLILLFERPVRVGDVVTVGNVVGRVTRIRIRATTIQDWDRKELVVPNREFVTSQFVNWTLSDPIVRMTIKVGVAYGTDTEQALQMLLQAAKESKYPLREPVPRAVFTGFGDSTLDLELRLYVDNFDDVPPMQTDVHQRIDRLYKEHGIEIAFPQRDLHLRSAAPLVEVLRREGVEQVR